MSISPHHGIMLVNSTNKEYYEQLFQFSDPRSHKSKTVLGSLVTIRPYHRFYLTKSQVGHFYHFQYRCKKGDGDHVSKTKKCSGISIFLAVVLWVNYIF